MTQRRVRFEYWTDPMCIWAFVAEPKLTRVLEEVGTHLEVDYRIVPVFGSVTQRLRDGGWAKEGREGRRSATKKVACDVDDLRIDVEALAVDLTHELPRSRRLAPTTGRREERLGTPGNWQVSTAHAAA